MTKLLDSQLVQNSGVFETNNGMPPADFSNATVSPSSVAFIPFRCNDPTEYDKPIHKRENTRNNTNDLTKRDIFCVRFVKEVMVIISCIIYSFDMCLLTPIMVIFFMIISDD